MRAIPPDDDWWPPIAHRAAASVAQGLSDSTIQAVKAATRGRGGKLLKVICERNFCIGHCASEFFLKMTPQKKSWVDSGSGSLPSE